MIKTKLKEKNIQTLFGKQNNIPGVYELKLCKGTSIRWDAVKDHQIKALTMAKSESGLYYKIPDSPVSQTAEVTRFTARKPFDCFFVSGFPAYVVVCWYVPRKRKTLYYIDICDYIDANVHSERKSYREDEARAMARFVVELKG